MRSILRQDPDVIMVGEIDWKPPNIAIESALTGHFVLSTLHTNSAPETITRLLDMDVKPFLITAALEAVLAQRLARSPPPPLPRAVPATREDIERLGLPKNYAENPKLRMFRAKGCAAGDFQGDMGRAGLFEMLIVNDHIKDLILERAMSFEIRRAARKNQGMRTLREEGIIKCIQGLPV